MIERIQKQQELNQQFDIMYDNVEKELVKAFLEEVWHDSAATKELHRMFDERDEKVRLEVKEKIKASITKKDLTFIDESERRKKAIDKNRKEFDEVIDRVKKELMDEYSIGAEDE